MKILLITVVLVAISTVFIGLADDMQQKHVVEVKISKCDSIHLANDSLSQRIEVLDRRLRQYQIGLWFLRDKDKQAYDYVINAGNLDFKNQW